MNYTERTYTQSEASKLTEIGQDILRDWRRRGFMEDVGERCGNGRWFYSFHEILTLTITKILEPNGQPISVLFFMAEMLVFSVLNYLRPDDPYESFSRDVSVFWFDDKGVLSTRVLASLDEIDSQVCAGPQAIIVSAARLSERLPDNTKAVIVSGLD